jgi:hypothetical protein
MNELIETSVENDPHRKEVRRMHRTIADALIAKGQKEGRKKGELAALRRTLSLQLQKRFGNLPPQTVALIKATKDIDQLNTWLDRFATATSLDEVGITLASK